MDIKSENTHSIPRRINAYIALTLIVLLIIHAALGTLGVALQWRGTLEAIIWIGVVFIGLHILLCICTTYTMFTDKVRPASSRKKRHQIIKWISGGIVLCTLVLHLCKTPLDVFAPTIAGGFLAAVLMVFLAWHSVVGVKSLTHDLRQSISMRTPMRVIIIVLAAIISIAMMIVITRC